VPQQVCVLGSTGSVAQYWLLVVQWCVAAEQCIEASQGLQCARVGVGWRCSGSSGVRCMCAFKVLSGLC
jgi:hypothetical protein